MSNFFDFTSYEVTAESGAVLELKDPAGRPALYPTDKDDPENPGKKLFKPITIMLVGTTSPRWTKATDELATKLKALKEERTIPEVRMDRAGLLAKMTLDWEGIGMDGKVLPCTEENAKKYYFRFPWVMDQVDKFIGDRASFLPASPSE